MPLSTIFTHYFPADVRKKGRDYFLSGCVRLITVNARSATANVSGGSVYRVELELVSGSKIKCRCSCPYIVSYGSVCKHIWATILAADSRQFAAVESRSGRLKLILDDPYSDEYEDEFDDEYDDDEYTSPPPVARRPTPAPPPPPKPPTRESWQQQLEKVEEKLSALQSGRTPAYRRPPADQQNLYVIDAVSSVSSQKLTMELMSQERKLNGEWGKPKSSRYSSSSEQTLTDPLDRQLLALFRGVDQGFYSYSYGASLSTFRLSVALMDATFPLLAQTSRVFLRTHHTTPIEIQPLTVELGTPWTFRMRVDLSENGKQWHLTGNFHRGEEKISLFAPSLILPGVLIHKDKVSRFDEGNSLAWMPILRQSARIAVPLASGAKLLEKLLAMPGLPPLDLPPELQFTEERIAPVPKVVIKPQKQFYGRPMLEIVPSFFYDDREVPYEGTQDGMFQADKKRYLIRDRDAEKAAEYTLTRLGARWSANSGERKLQIQPAQLPKLVRELVSMNWKIEADGKLYRQAGSFDLRVETENDWFDLNGTANFDGQLVPFPRLLEAMRKGENTVVLGDGSLGMLPEEWLKKYGLFAQMGTVDGDSVRFSKTQIGLLDALLASRPDVTFDEQFGKAREELRKFDGIKPEDPPKQFTGDLREYQREGLGWLKFIRKFGFGGCLADDMGLGKTVQVLSLLSGKRTGPALVVVPRSLIFNWKQEAAKFAPHLKVIDHSGSTRDKTITNFDDYDIVLTTYGTLRNDAEAFSKMKFDTCILDESQAAKNANTETAKAVRIIQADHRLALSGTPVENHLGELWTLFDFLNPGMLGRVAFLTTGGASFRNPDEETRKILAKALKPFILRRTKSEVAKDLPAKSEQTVYCDLEAEQRQLYDELREHYRQSLLSKIDTLGIKRSKIQILEALLRLRQAACHPGLIDKKRKGDASAKLDVLMPQLTELAEGGSKVLVFSQFTSFLDIVRTKLNADKIPFEYLDGKTRDRAARVERFQNDPDCKLFLVSLKAGGVGLNLTAAEYVFLLDPWWNPAVEAQAIDRTHRIGQTKPVFAYRLIARNTVEEKVLALQQSKRALADAILGGDGSLITDLKREDLELLLS